MLCLSVSDLSLSFGTVPVLENVSFSLEENDRLGIIGVNGCGKSTLFRLICGELEPTSGAVYLSKGKTVGILRQDDAFDASFWNGWFTPFPTCLRRKRGWRNWKPTR